MNYLWGQLWKTEGPKSYHFPHFLPEIPSEVSSTSLFSVSDVIETTLCRAPGLVNNLRRAFRPLLKWSTIGLGLIEHPLGRWKGAWGKSRHKESSFPVKSAESSEHLIIIIVTLMTFLL